MVASVLILFCRIGACLMLAPGFSSPRLPARPRLIHRAGPDAGAGAAADGRQAFRHRQSWRLSAADIFGELFIGGVIGLLGRFYFLALETMMMAASMSIGLSNALGAPIDETEVQPPIATLITLTATCLIFVSDLHWELIRGVVASYSVMPVGFALRPQAALTLAADDLARAFVVGLAHRQPIHRLRGDRQSRHRSGEPADAANPDLFHLGALRHRWRIDPVLFRFRFDGHGFHGRIRRLGGQGELMRERQKSLQRLLAVKSQLHRLEEARLIETQRRKQALAEDRRALFDLLGKAEQTDRLLLGLACRQIRRTEEGERDLAAAEKAQTLALLERSAQKKALEKSLKRNRNGAGSSRRRDGAFCWSLAKASGRAPRTSLSVKFETLICDEPKGA